jgi:very-short-patch-repair endonuclease
MSASLSWPELSRLQRLLRARYIDCMKYPALMAPLEETRHQEAISAKHPHYYLFHPRSVADHFRADSVIETSIMLRILETSPGVDITGWYALEATYEEAKALLETVSAYPAWPDFIVFPQLVCGPYRVDFMIAVRRPNQPMPTPYHSFVIEADGAEFHAGQVREDLDRQGWVRSRTGMDFLRFSGAEILYAAD